MDHEANRRTLLGLNISPEVADFLLSQKMNEGREPLQIPEPSSAQGWEYNGQRLQDTSSDQGPPTPEPQQPMPPPEAAGLPSRGNFLRAPNLQPPIIPGEQGQPQSQPQLEDGAGSQGSQPYNFKFEGLGQGLDRKTYEDSEKRAKMFELLAGLSEAGSKFSSAQTSGEIMLHQPKEDPSVAVALRSRAAEERDMISPAERDFYKSMGFEIPHGLKRSQLKQTMPLLSRVVGSGMNPEALDIRKGNLSARNRGLDIQETKMGQLPNAAVDQVTSMKYSLGMIDKIKGRLNQGGIGPVAGRWQEFARKIGMGNPEAAVSQAALSDLFTEFAFGKGGKNLTVSESSHFRNQLPQVWDDPASLAALLDDYGERIRMRMDSVLGGQAANKRDVSGFQDGAGQPSGTWVRMVDPNGNEQEVHPEDVDEAKSEGWKTP